MHVLGVLHLIMNMALMWAKIAEATFSRYMKHLSRRTITSKSLYTSVKANSYCYKYATLVYTTHKYGIKYSETIGVGSP